MKEEGRCERSEMLGSQQVFWEKKMPKNAHAYLPHLEPRGREETRHTKAWVRRREGVGVVVVLGAWRGARCANRPRGP